MKGLKLAKTGYLAMSVAFYIAGIVCMILPEIPPFRACVVSGIVLICYGIIKIIGYFSKELYCLAFQYDLACGLLLIVLGVIILTCSQQIMPHLFVGLGVLVLLDSLLSIQMSKDSKQFGLETWYVILITSVVAGVFGVLLIVIPPTMRLARHIMSGAALLSMGFKNQCVMHYAVSNREVQIPEEE